MLKSLEKPSKVSKTTRIIGSLEGKTKGPTVVFFGGIHGNEPAGIIALEKVFSRLDESELEIKGSVFGIRGNIPALLQRKRYVQKDLNRLWSSEQIAKIEKKDRSNLCSEEIELLEIKQIIVELLESQSAPFYFIDFHTTSSKTLPFITINDALINRKFSEQFPVPLILGIEEYLEGPLLSRMNQLGYISLGFESGQHDEPEAIENSIAFFWLTLVFTCLLNKEQVSDYELQFELLTKSAMKNADFYEVAYRHILNSKDEFSMLPGFKSFQKVVKGTPLALQNQKEISAKKNGILFMPLYQEQGAEGFFLIKKISKVALSLSIIMRRTRLERFLVLLPGISWYSPKRQALLVNLSIARFFTKSFFHLLGYRSQARDKTHILMYNRELTAKNHMYRNEPWHHY